jgi:hypothetical protein
MSVTREPGRVREVAGRLLAAAAVGLAAASTAYLCAYSNMRDHSNYRLDDYVQHELNMLEEAVEKHRRTTGRLPASLTELEGVKDRHRLNGAGQVIDMWEHPFQYRVEGETFTLYSLGREGRSGGEGLDADIYPSSAGRPIESPTLRQFTFDLPTRGVQLTSLLAGVCAGLVCLRSSRNRRGVGWLALVVATALGAVLIAVVLSFLHIPTGH